MDSLVVNMASFWPLDGVNGIPKGVGISTSHKLFAPRAGFAYRLGSRTVIRSGYGLTCMPLAMARPLRGFFPLMYASNFNSANSFQPVRTIEHARSSPWLQAIRSCVTFHRDRRGHSTLRNVY
jgi:hypothetical protein